MASISKADKLKIEEIRERKKRTLETIVSILDTIWKDNKDIFRKANENRLKEYVSIIKKMKKNEDCKVNNIETFIEDIAGARMTCCTLDEIPIAQKLIEKHHDILECKITREVTEDTPDENGYIAHHLMVTVNVHYQGKKIEDKCEIQIRTLAQDLWAVLSHRDFYKNKNKIPDLVKHDMVTLSKLLQAADRMALSLKKRVREEIDKEIHKTSISVKDMLTPENIQKFIKNKFNEDVTIDFAYEIISEILSLGFKSLKKYKQIIETNSINTWLKKEFKKVSVPLNLKDKLIYPALYKCIGQMDTENILRELLLDRRENEYEEIEKGVFVPKEKKGTSNKKKSKLIQKNK